MHRMRVSTSVAALAALLASPAFATSSPVSQPAAASGQTYSPAQPAYAAGYWYPSAPGVTAAGIAIAAGSVYLEPVHLGQSVTLDQIGVLVTTAGAAGSQGVAYVYGGNTAGNRPSGLPLGQCTITTINASGLQACTFATPVALTGNKVYWLGWEVNATASAAIFQTVSGAVSHSAWAAGFTSTGSIGSVTSKLSLVFGNSAHGFGVASNPATYSPAMVEAFGNTRVPIFYLHVVSVP